MVEVSGRFDKKSFGSMPFKLICCPELIELPNNMALLLSARLLENSRLLSRQYTRDAASPSDLAKLVCFPVAAKQLCSHHKQDRLSNATHKLNNLCAEAVHIDLGRP